MRLLTILDALASDPRALAPLASGTSPVGRAAASLSAAIAAAGFTTDLLILCPPGGAAGFSGAVPGVRAAEFAGEGRAAFFKFLAGAAKGYDSVVHAWADSPIVDAGAVAELLSMHGKWKSQYSFADGFPEGLIPEIVDSRLLGALAELALKAPGGFDRDFFFQVLSKDINAFDVETLVAKTDMRPWRLRLFCDWEGGRILADRLIARGAEDAQTILAALEADPLIPRTVPAFVAVQTEGGCPQRCSICPYPSMNPGLLSDRAEMPADRFVSIARQARDMSGRIVVSPSLWGEPALHSGIVAMVEGCLAEDGVDLLIETSGVGWKKADLDKMLSAASALPPGKLRWIVSLDALSEGTYSRLRGEGRAEAYAFAERLVAAAPEAAYVQAVRVAEAEEELESFWKHWKARTDKVIVQKYDHFSGRLPDRRVTDISPLHRRPCWHLARDLSVLIDGTVPMCKDDLARSRTLGNAFNEGLAACWERGGAIYAEHASGRHEGICAGCDEHYTYNF